MLKSHWNPKLQTARPKKARKERMSRSKRAKRRRGRTSDQGERTEKYVDWTWWRGCLSNHNFNSRSYCQLTNWAHIYIDCIYIYILWVHFPILPIKVWIHIMAEIFQLVAPVFETCVVFSPREVQSLEHKSAEMSEEGRTFADWGWSTLWLCQNSYWKWWFIVDFPIKYGDFP